jgi:hypothetical protein
MFQMVPLFSRDGIGGRKEAVNVSKNSHSTSPAFWVSVMALHLLVPLGLKTQGSTDIHLRGFAASRLRGFAASRLPAFARYGGPRARPDAFAFAIFASA